MYTGNALQSHAVLELLWFLETFKCKMVVKQVPNLNRQKDLEE